MGCKGCSGSATPNGCGNSGLCSSGGCNKLNVFDWLSDLKNPSGTKPYDLVEVKFKNNRKEIYRNVEHIDLETGDWVAVDAQKGHDVGFVSLKGELVRLQLRRKGLEENGNTYRNIYRKASKRDLEILEKSRTEEKAVRERSREIIAELGLDMKLSDVEYQGDKSKITFYYIAESRVDFRELIKVLAREFRSRIEMRQIGARQEAALVGGIGPCGRELCCSSWMAKFKSVSASAARYQNLSVNPAKLSGQCGRLKCCLNYELDTYLDALNDFPKEIKRLDFKEGKATLIKTDIFKKLLWYNYGSDKSNVIKIGLEQVHEVLRDNKSGRTPDNPDAYVFAEAFKTEDVDLDLGETSINRFDSPKRKKKKKKRRGRHHGQARNRKSNQPNKS